MTAEETFAWFMPGDPPPADECWDWNASADGRYGQFRISGTKVYAHIVSHRVFNAHDPITAEKPYVLHWCDRQICVQPAHLHAGTHRDNMREASERGLIVNQYGSQRLGWS